MAGDTSKNSTPPEWYAAGLEHVWLPYAQMKTVTPPLAVVRTQGSRIVLADGRELIDGVASWWTACHGYNQAQIRHAVARQLKQMPHVMFGGLAHEPALTLARRPLSCPTSSRCRRRSPAARCRWPRPSRPVRCSMRSGRTIRKRR